MVTIQDAMNMEPGAYYLGHREKSLAGMGIEAKFQEVIKRHIDQGERCFPEISEMVAAGFDRYQLANCLFNWLSLWPYVKDGTRDGDGRVDHWETLAEFIRSGGDCEGYGIGWYFLMREHGIPAEDLRLVLGYDRRGEGHAVCALHLPIWKQWCFLDNARTVVMLGELGGFIPKAAVNEDGAWICVEQPPEV